MSEEASAEIESKIKRGQLITCTKEEYENGTRSDLQDFAGKMIDFGQHVHANIALNEVKRLDTLFKFKL